MLRFDQPETDERRSPRAQIILFRVHTRPEGMFGGPTDAGRAMKDAGAAALHRAGFRVT